MMAPYLWRLVCLSLAAFFVVHAAVGALVAMLAPAAVRAGLRMRARGAAAMLFALRLAPVTAAIAVVAGVCVPSYLLLEERTNAEEIGGFCVAAALLGIALWAVSIARGVRAVNRSRRLARDWERAGATCRIEGAGEAVYMVEAPAPVLALAGVFRPRLVISKRVAAALSAEQLQAALRHEEAHRAAHDNLKRLVMLLSPGLLPGLSGFGALERGWFRFTEWAADDDAVAGNPRLSVSLAAALVRIARMGGTPAPAPLSATFLADGRDLKARVDRLLRPSAAGSGKPAVALGLAMAVAIGLAVHGASLEGAHRMLEMLLR